MSLRERFEQLEERERKLLGILVGVFGVMVVLGIPMGLGLMLSSQRDDNRAIRDAVLAVEDDRALIEKRASERELVEARYKNRAPQLAGFLAQAADRVGIEIPETQDRSPVPHGKKFKERSSKINLRKVGLLPLAQFMERIEQSGHPVSISRLSIRKRGTKPDEYDVEMIVSAFDEEQKKEKKASEEGESAEEQSE